ncbi:extracellular calcium-sensing receptor-like isoform X2 [Festucalex cinctus]
MSWLSWFSAGRWPSSAPLVILVGLVSRRPGLALTCPRWGAPVSRGLFQDGDVVIGGLFHIHYKPPALDHHFADQPDYKECTGLEQLPLQYIYAMMFAVEEINRSPRLLPGVTLGYHIRDSCARHPWATQAALSLVSGGGSACNPAATQQNASEGGSGRGVPLIIGGASSKTAMILSRVLGPLSVPLMSYQSSCPCLSDRRQFPNFFRTIPSDIYQARAIARLAIYFKWTWIGAVVANNDYGLVAVKVFQEETQGSGVCLAFVETLNRQNIANDARRAALAIKASSARVILIFSWYTDVRELFLQLAQMNVTDRQFLASEAWSTSGNLLQHPVTSQVASGVVGTAIRSSTIVGFEDYLRSLTPSARPDDDILRDFWEKQFACRLRLSNGPNSSDRSTSLPLCRGDESLEGVNNLFTDTSQLRQAYNVYLAVYAAAHALHDLLACPNATAVSQDDSATCSSPRNVKPAELLQRLNDVNFTTPQGERLYFQGADIPAKYDLVNWQKSRDGSLKLVLVGRVDGYQIRMNDTAVQWRSGSSQVPASVCSESCPPGTRVATRKGEPVCCFDCIRCAEGEISNATDSPNCDRCPLEFWPNTEHTVCVLRQLDFLAFNETLGVTLAAVAVSGAVATTAVFVVFVYYRHTPVVRANNSELSFLLLLSLQLCFLCSLLFIGRPSAWSCRFQQAAFAISFALSVSCLQVKTIVVLAAFRSARPGAGALMKWFGPGQQRGSVCVFTCIQIVICIIWLSLSPPEPKPDFGTPGLKVTLKCDMASVVGFSLVLGYIGLLACSCLLLAFLARKLPDNFNEAKLITFSMLIFCAVWVAFVPAYVSSPGKYTVAVEIFAILASSFGLLVCIFAPKCFIILVRPERNTKKYMMAR